MKRSVKMIAKWINDYLVFTFNSLVTKIVARALWEITTNEKQVDSLPPCKLSVQVRFSVFVISV